MTYAQASKKKYRHHNRRGNCQVKKGLTVLQMKSMAKRLGVPYYEEDKNIRPEDVHPRHPDDK